MQQVANQQEAAEPADNSAATEAARTAQQATQAAQTVQSVTGELAALDGEYETLLEEVRRVSRWDGGRGWVGLSWVTQLCVCVRVCTWRLQLKQQSEADASTLAAKQSLERARQKQSLEVRTHHHVLPLCRTSPNPFVRRLRHAARGRWSDVPRPSAVWLRHRPLRKPHGCFVRSWGKQRCLETRWHWQSRCLRPPARSPQPTWKSTISTSI